MGKSLDKNSKPEPILDINIENEDETISDGDLDVGVEIEDSENPIKSLENTDELIQQSDDSTSHEGLTKQDKLDDEEDSVPEEAKVLLRPNMKNKTQKRIVSLVTMIKKQDEKLQKQDEIISKLLEKETIRTQKEEEVVSLSKYQEILKKQKEAFENGDMEAVAQANFDLLDLKQNSTSTVPATNINADEYFKNKYKWYEVDERKTNTAIGIDTKLRNDPYWKVQPIEKRLMEVGKRTEELFKKNDFRNSSPSEGVSTVRSQSLSNSDISVTKSTLDLYRKMYPNLSPVELNKMIKKIESRIKEKEVN